MQSVNPANGLPLGDYPEDDGATVEQRLAGARDAFAVWRSVPLEARAAGLQRAARVLRARRDPLAALMTAEMGKPIAAAEAEVEKCAWVCEHYAEHAASYLAPEPAATDARRSYVRYDPLGIILAVMPWNFPFWQVFRCAAPALVAGNGVVLKHASNVPGCALAIESVFEAAELTPGIFVSLIVRSAAVGGLIDHDAIAAVSLTGSEAAGREVAARAGAALKKTVLELGGSDAFVVLADADPVRAAEQAVLARTLNNGQSCIAAKRFIVEAPLAARFEDELIARMEALVMGDPAERRVQIGPLARHDLRLELQSQVDRSVATGAVLRLGGRIPPGPGFYYPPTVLADVTPGMAAFDEETFGPLAAITRASDAAQAIELANRSRFGLGASLWTADSARGEALAAGIEAGAVFVNGIVKSDPRLPFGGIKRSGYGRELAVHGIREFVNAKAVWIG